MAGSENLIVDPQESEQQTTVHICSNNNLYLLEEVDEKLFPKFANKTEMAYFP